MNTKYRAEMTQIKEFDVKPTETEKTSFKVAKFYRFLLPHGILTSKNYFFSLKSVLYYRGEIIYINFFLLRKISFQNFLWKLLRKFFFKSFRGKKYFFRIIFCMTYRNKSFDFVGKQCSITGGK